MTPVVAPPPTHPGLARRDSSEIARAPAPRQSRAALPARIDNVTDIEVQRSIAGASRRAAQLAGQQIALGPDRWGNSIEASLSNGLAVGLNSLIPFGFARASASQAVSDAIEKVLARHGEPGDTAGSQLAQSIGAWLPAALAFGTAAIVMRVAVAPLVMGGLAKIGVDSRFEPVSPEHVHPDPDEALEGEELEAAKRAAYGSQALVGMRQNPIQGDYTVSSVGGTAALVASFVLLHGMRGAYVDDPAVEGAALRIVISSFASGLSGLIAGTALGIGKSAARVNVDVDGVMRKARLFIARPPSTPDPSAWSRFAARREGLELAAHVLVSVGLASVALAMSTLPGVVMQATLPSIADPGNPAARRAANAITAAASLGFSVGIYFQLLPRVLRGEWNPPPPPPLPLPLPLPPLSRVSEIAPRISLD